ncbi:MULTISPECIES: hypothetical protein [unclassified Actinotalea]|nr:MULTISPECIES: hypothetical protein [unclassified Actinotalea]
MNRIAKTLAAVVVTLGLTVVGLPLGSGGVSTLGVGSTGCCKM